MRFIQFILHFENETGEIQVFHQLKKSFSMLEHLLVWNKFFFLRSAVSCNPFSIESFFVYAIQLHCNSVCFRVRFTSNRIQCLPELLLRVCIPIKEGERKQPTVINWTPNTIDTKIFYLTQNISTSLLADQEEICFRVKKHFFSVFLTIIKNDREKREKNAEMLNNMFFADHNSFSGLR